MKLAGECKGNLEAVQALIEAGACVNAVDDAGQTPLSVAFQENHFAIMDLLLAAGADINAPGNRRGESCLHLAVVVKSDPEVIMFLLNRGADINSKDKFGLVPLQKAVLAGNIAMMELLLLNGADATVTDNNGWSLLHCAARYGQSEAVQWLLDTGTNINIKCSKGFSPLHFAAQSGHFSVVQLLIDRGAKINLKDSRGWTALHWANYCHHKAVAKLIQNKTNNRRFSQQDCAIS